SGRKPGGQPGRQGRTLRQVSVPDEVMVHEPGACAGCGANLPAGDRPAAMIRRQVFDIPKITVRVVEHRLVSRRCGGRGMGAAARRALAEAELVHLDETGLRVAGRLHWLHVATNSRFTALFCHRRRGKQAIDAAGVLPHVTGTLVHDAFAPYARYPAARHALCNAHLLRELIAVVDSHAAHPPPSSGALPAGWCWAAQIIDALLALKAVTDTGALPDADTLAAHRRLIVSAALVGASAEAGPPGAVGRRHRALARRIRRRLEDYLRFAIDSRVPFDNNPA